ncbi:YggS family pyridoxal phosphate-dependent enzyme [Beggiatoa leptomitoformis]|uniref:Pyridoxal phosphate homeostasis protein n=1 Tax=Beggiatoa leptomitoformis TaxID=288004 RepID=A0A2N9YHF6_9GAMM|nr:YggS family pyridoxal phosphate-dependent enzyme [Beggiatoa leptomitoformis]ALG67791.1 YggS family pyridoxal phosphate-dependent enzyme [Beggiatoa leptomitoformis]AUI69962.1 YggS family pyridoxal phosphate-dependent enzyme [Beggiatoa leptomitoformis]
MSSIADTLTHVRQQILMAERQFNRPANSVQLLAVSKMQPKTAIINAIKAGQTCFGENYVQEAVEKIQALRVDYPQVEWHFIGALQTNKTRVIATHFHWVHTLDNLKQAKRLSEQRPQILPPLQVCIQVNISAEPQKAGVSVADVPALALAIQTLPNIKLRGLMAIPAPAADFTTQCQPFHLLNEMLQQLQAQGLSLDTLSMGMTDDMQAAIAQGATIVRIGTAIFGARSAKTE